MNKLLLIFDYFKEAFHINKQNKALYKPQIALIAVDVLIILLVGIGVYSWIGIENIRTLTEMGSSEILGFVLNQGFKVIAIILAYALISVILEAGLLNMYKKAVTQGYTEPGDFREGLSKYFVKLLLGKLLIFLCYIPALPFYLLIGIITLTVGLAVIPIIVGVFLTMWKVSLVMNDVGIIEALKDSFQFAKRNFMPLTVLQIIHWAFARGVSGGGGGGGGGNFNLPNTNGYNQGPGQGFNNEFFNIPGAEQGIEVFIRIIKIMVAVLIPIITIASIFASLIAMVFNVFFTLTLFVAYKNGFIVEEKQLPIPEEPEALEANVNISEEAPIAEEVDTIADNEETNNEEVEQ
jgi:hypothetical protein